MTDILIARKDLTDADHDKVDVACDLIIDLLGKQFGDDQFIKLYTLETLLDSLKFLLTEESVEK